MPDTCIVCLGDLGGGASPSPSSPVVAEAVPRPDNNDDDDGGNIIDHPRAGVDAEEDPGQIARLLPCGHILHNNCLKPWVERANSCPICRRNFNVVELSDTPGGPVISSYVVQDKVQVPDIDPSMIIEEVTDDSDSQPCAICGDNDNEEVLLLCDGCDVPSHTYCLGLDAIPSESWYCDQCETQRAIGAVSDASSRPLRSRPERRTRAQQRRLRIHNQASSLQWARVWQSVYDSLNLDLDFPFDDEQTVDRFLQQTRRRAAQRRDFRSWQRRFQIAERQGGGHRFREPAAILDEYAPRPSRPRVPRAPTPEPESLEEMRAWNAFERARELENDPSAARKRKSPTLSPSPEPAEPERKLKRPRTRRPEELAAMAAQNGEASRSAARLNAENNGGPSFLQSLLKEVEDSYANRNSSVGPSAQSSNTSTDHHNTSGPSSPSLSPASSNPTSPRLSSTSPPPHMRRRPVSPVQSGSSDPVSPSSPDFSPSVSPVQSTETRRSRPEARHIRGSRLERSAGRSNDGSPSRNGPSLSVKTDVQKLVGAELKPFYRRKEISKDQYTDINRTISRKLYERVGEVETLEADKLAELKEVASEEVKKAVEALQRKTEDRGESES
ncbi:hypothetical protein VTN77DRAFT_5234 [Rasamsonia byssochlamydoides]|uniref:uncharacterized protein n=1 Tax=Rasamsonia byssochlamydoides TaxID=89139 RepID=UPI0037449710